MRTRFHPLAPIPLAVACLALTPVPLLAQSTVDTPVELQETDHFGLGARAMGMGNAMIAVSGDMSAVGVNPAGLAGLRNREASFGLAVDDATSAVTHTDRTTTDFNTTRFEHFLVAFPIPRLERNVTVALGFHRMANLDARFYKEGYLIAVSPGSPGLYEVDDYKRDGSIDAWTAAVGGDVSPTLSLGAAVHLLTGRSHEDLLQANYRATQSGNDVILDVGDPSSPDDRLFENRVHRRADLIGITGSLGLLARFDPGVKVGATIDLPTDLNWDGHSQYRLEDWQKIDGNLGTNSRDYFEDDMTLPLSLSGGVSWERNGILLAGGLRWTDWTQIDYEGPILEPNQGPGLARESAYRSTVAINLGGEYQVPQTPLAVRAGFFTDPLPYRLIAADTDFQFVADDGDPNTTSDASSVLRDYPRADISKDRKGYTLGVGLKLQETLRLDAAYIHESSERSTPSGYENTTDVNPTIMTTETVKENRFFLGATARVQ